MTNVYKIAARALRNLWRNQTVTLFRNGPRRVDFLDRSIFYKLSLFAGVMRPPIVNQIVQPSVEEMSSAFLAETEFVSEVDCLEWDGFLWAVPKKRTSHSKKRMRMAKKYLKPIRHYTVCPKCQNLKLLHVLCGYCLKETLKKTAAMRLEEQREQENS